MANHKFESMMKMAKANNAEREIEKQKPEDVQFSETVNTEAVEIVSKVDKVPTRGRKKKSGGESPVQRSSAEKGCKPGYSRHGYVLPLTMIEQISNMAKNFGYTESAVTEMLIQKGINEVIAKHGKSCVSEKKAKELF